MCSSYDAHFALEPGAALRAHPLLGEADQFHHVGGGGAPEVHDEVRVQRRDLGAALALALESGGLDQPARRSRRAGS